MEKYPVESSYARMLVEAEDKPSEIKTKLAAIIAIQEVGGIVKGGTRYTGWQKLTKQRKSDLLAQYDVYRNLSQVLPEEYEDTGIISKNITKASEVMQRLNHDLHGIELDESLLTAITEEEEQQLLRCIVAGQIDQIWSVDEFNYATHIITNDTRELSSSSIVRNPRLITGTPFDLEIPTSSGGLQTLHLVQGITAISTEWLTDLAPHLFTAKRGKMVYDPRIGGLVIRQQVKVGKRVFEGTGIPVTQNTKQNQKFFQEAVAKWIYEQLERESRQLSLYHAKRIPKIPIANIRGRVRHLAGNVISIEDLKPPQRQLLFEMTKLETHLGSDFMNQVAGSYRKGRGPGRHHSHRGWKPAHRRHHR